ncbi:MAG: ATP-grasp domain-containing protein [Limisphaerales bacterium]
MPRIYDVVMTHKLDADDFFIHRVQQHCAERRLNFFLIEPLWVEAVRSAFEHGKVWARVLLNLHSEHHQPDDVYHRLVKLAAERRTQVIDPPAVALAAFDKARLHRRLLDAGFHVPHTVIVPREQAPAFQLVEADRVALGLPFVIKPGLGYGKRGVVMDATSERDLARSIAGWADPNYLLQRRIVPRSLDGSPAYFRVFFVFGSVWSCWWNCYTDKYRLITEAEAAQWNLAALTEIIRRLAALAGMNFFSSEIAQDQAGEFILIDYVNDQCHMLSQSANPAMGVPDELVAAIAARLVEAAHQLIVAAR